MPDTQPFDKHEWVKELFQTILKILKELDWPKQESPSIFLVYAHDNEAMTKAGIKADNEVAQQLIQWLRELGANIYSDRTAVGNSAFIGQPPADRIESAHDILSSQLCLLPALMADLAVPKRVDHVILCGSGLLGHYLSSEQYYQGTYYPALKKAYESVQVQANNSEARAIRDCVNAQVKAEGFHHVLTELAFLEIRVNSSPHNHGILPVLLNGVSKKSFPPFILDSTTIRIEDMAWREAGYWKGQVTYENQGLHKGFFKLLKRLWVGQERTIQILGERVYDHCIQALQSSSAPESAGVFVSFMKKTVLEAQGSLIQEAQSTLRTLDTQKFFEKIMGALHTLQEQLTKPAIDPDTIRKALHDATRDRLEIQRVSNQTLPMAQCYINLAVVEHKRAKTKKQEETEAKEASEKMTAAFHRLPSFEAIDKTNLQAPILLEDLFNSRKLNSGIDGVPQCILIRGRAGIGKTTLSKKSVYEYMEHQMWKTQFDWLLWIPLRKLKGKPENYQLKTLLYDEYFHGHPHPQDWALAQALYQQIQAAPNKTLFILDGWDEVAQEEPIACLKALLNHPAVIITSRPYGVDLSQIKPDLELETIGFSQANVTAYLDNRDIVQQKEESDEIKQFIQGNPSIRALINVPILLDALCYSWDYIKHRQTKTHTMTGLYQAMVHKLWSKDILRLDKQENGKSLTAKAIHSIRRPSRFESLVQPESDCLGALALNGLHRNQIEFTLNALDDVIEKLREQGVPLSLTLEQSLNELSCLHVEKEIQAENPSSYSFLHLSFQEFFAALWLVKCMIQHKPLGLLQAPAMTPHDFIRQHKYNPRYEIVWWFTAGLLSGEALNHFFEVLDQEPQDLIGIQHQYLMIHCLQESNGRLSSEQRRSLESNLYAWLRFEMKINAFYQKPSSLGCQAAFPEVLLLQLLVEEQSHREKSMIAKSLGQRPALSREALACLITLAKDKDWLVKTSAAVALGQQLALPPEALACLIALLKDKEKHVRQSAANALGRQLALPQEALTHLIALLKDEYWHVRSSAVNALGRQLALPTEILERLIALLKDEEQHVRSSAANALGQQPALPPEALDRLIALLKEKDWEMKYSAIQVLGQQPALPPQALDCLIILSKDENEDVRQSVVKALGRQLALPQALQGLIALLKDKDWRVRESAAKALGSKPALFRDVLESLIDPLKNENWYVRSSAAEALGQQPALPLATLQGLIALLKDKNWCVRNSAAKALGQQLALPQEALTHLIDLSKEGNKHVRESAVKALGRQLALPQEALTHLIDLLKDKDWRVRESAAKALGRQPALSQEAFTHLIDLLKDKNWCVRNSAAKALGRQPAFSPETLTCLIALVKDEVEGIEQLIVEALGPKSALPSETLACLIALLKDENKHVRNSAAEVLRRRPVWERYRLLSTGEPLLLKDLYSQWLIEQNFQQIVPLYLENNNLYFYTSTELQSVSLTEEAAFRQAIWNAQTTVGIPSASRVKLIQSPASVQDDAIPLASRFSNTFFHESRDPHDNEPHDNASNRLQESLRTFPM